MYLKKLGRNFGRQFGDIFTKPSGHTGLGTVVGNNSSDTIRVVVVIFLSWLLCCYNNKHIKTHLKITCINYLNFVAVPKYIIITYDASNNSLPFA
jgi:hypothetical protein